MTLKMCFLHSFRSSSHGIFPPTSFSKPIMIPLSFLTCCIIYMRIIADEKIMIFIFNCFFLMWHLFENGTLMWCHFSILYHSMKINPTKQWKTKPRFWCRNKGYFCCLNSHNWYSAKWEVNMGRVKENLDSGMQKAVLLGDLSATD